MPPNQNRNAMKKNAAACCAGSANRTKKQTQGKALTFPCACVAYLLAVLCDISILPQDASFCKWINTRRSHQPGWCLCAGGYPGLFAAAPPGYVQTGPFLLLCR